jgi:hypothetical protein
MLRLTRGSVHQQGLIYSLRIRLCWPNYHFWELVVKLTLETSFLDLPPDIAFDVLPTSLFYWFYGPLGPWLLIFQFHNHFTDGRTPWMGDQLVVRPLPNHKTAQIQDKHTYTHQTSMPCVALEHTILASEREKTVHASDSSVKVTGTY